MSIHERIADLVGDWKGTNVLHVPWMPEPVKRSDSTANVTSKMNGQFLSIDYTWSYDGEPQAGMLIIGCDPKSKAVQAVWTDSWHSKDSLMLCNGERAAAGEISVMGYYSVPDHPDWGWQTDIIPTDEGFRYVMYNVSPEGVSELAVETNFVKA